ncbi:MULTISPECIES: PD-(D/E)XK nuclease family protein [Bacillota]|uniref:PDDEXK-like family protein n=1 Tax=Bacillota TaxID=1239 RepID=UPI0008A04DEC|nr:MULTISPECIES: PD-(D/E)XK nuclease family protein [Bacillota]MCR1935034.1 PD-(D/E)XK nuclease family protein [Clostridium tepidum]SCL81711.1 hypothetical protein PP176A_0117 [Sporanaerobacter sp. PP17-6a]STA93537.1 Uncharacterised protein [Clostridium cochlearium]
MQQLDIINFIVNNDKLELIKAKLNRFNPFKILKIEDYEIRHSNVLAWLLDPNGNHNFDEKILKKFLLKVLMKPDNDEVLSNINLVYKIQNMNFMDICVYREMYNIDLVMVSEIQRLVIFIENKILSEEHSNQLSRYYCVIQDNFPDYTIIPIFLTLDGKEASSENYFRASYSDLLETMEFIVENYKERTSQEIVAFVSYYISIIKEKYFMDEDLKRLCKDIYIQNKDVIDMIYSIGNEIDIEVAVNQFISKHKEIIPVTQKNTVFWFGLESFLKARKTEADSWGGGFPICLWFSEYYGKLKLTLEVGPFEDSDERITFLNELELSGIKISERAKEPGRKYTRIYTDTISIKDWSDSEEIYEKMETLYNKKDFISTKNKAIEAVDRTAW